MKPPSPPFAGVAAVLLLIVGIQFWLLFGGGNYGRHHAVWWIAIAVIAGIIPPIRRIIDRAWESVSGIIFQKRVLIACAIAVIVAPLLYWMERSQGISLRLYFHDDFSYWLQMHMLARGRLWEPALPL